MLSTHECRRILKNPDLSDSEIEELLSDVYSWLNQVIDAELNNPLQ
jgi:metal-sulfur cluster biosynthetic enzyme